ncbi:uncharacterized protein LOC130690484 [Daphnia carinata]|uniref:uncharacterized protein LOC130690484 n=1 Tax=Daphnia carinata TaxID=120202 RepID=UPI00257DE6F1|nr:uncharacterized protein LOC130690484 [Daphnia carinata]XP_059351802.1 uncharacterized protein LOC130690484 [Daphnia carinata]
MKRYKSLNLLLLQTFFFFLLLSEMFGLPHCVKRGKRQTSGGVTEEKLSVKSSDSGKLGDPRIVKDVGKKLEKPRWLGGELYVSNKEHKRILKNLGAHYKKSMELAQSLLTDIVEIWWRIEDTSKDADPITDGPDSYNLADLLLLAKDSGLCHETHTLPPSDDEDKPKPIGGSEINETLSENEDPQLESSLTLNTTIVQPPKKSETKEDLVRRLKLLGDELEQSDHELPPKLLTDFKEAWLRIANKSNEFFDVRIPQSRLEEEDLRTYTARLLFLANDRPCESPDETFFKGHCLLLGPTDHCPENMEMNDGPKNQGFCDCAPLDPAKEKSELRVVYSAQKKKCYSQNTQGPCPNGQWLVLKNNVPQCEENSGGCPTDGRHVYWSPDAGVLMTKKCWEIGTKGPCDPDERLHLRQDTGDVEVYCDRNLVSISSSVIIPPVPAYRAACQAGSYRKQRLKCERPFL